MYDIWICPKMGTNPQLFSDKPIVWPPSPVWPIIFRYLEYAQHFLSYGILAHT